MKISKFKIKTLISPFITVLGVTSIVNTSIIGNSIKENSESISEKIIEISSASNLPRYADPKNSKGPYLDDKLIAELKKLDGIEGILYVLDTTSDIGVLAGYKDKYQSFGRVYGVNFEDIEKCGLKLIDNKSNPLKNYKFNPSDETIKAVSGQYFEYDFVDKSIKNENDKKAYRSENSPFFKYYSSTEYNSNIESPKKAEILPPFVDASKDKITLAIKGEDNKYKKYQLNLCGRFNWESVKNNNWLNSWASSNIFVDLETAKTLIRESKKLNKTIDSSLNSSKSAPEFQYSKVAIISKSAANVKNLTKKIQKMGYCADNYISN